MVKKMHKKTFTGTSVTKGILGVAAYLETASYKLFLLVPLFTSYRLNFETLSY